MKQFLFLAAAAAVAAAPAAFAQSPPMPSKEGKGMSMSAHCAEMMKKPAAGASDHGAMMKKGAGAAMLHGEGVVKAADATAQSVTIAHEPIAALQWPAMTMRFKATSDVLKPVKPGQRVGFCFEPEGAGYRITMLTVR